MSQAPVDHETLYRQVLSDYCRNQNEESLYQASLLSSTLIERGLGPDEIVALHYEGMQVVAQDGSLPHTDRIRILNDAHQFLLEVMIAYGAQYKEFLDLKLAEAIRRAENAEHGEREKLDVLAMIAHELGNPLTVALGNMQLAVKFLDSQDLTNVRNLVGESSDALQRLASLTGQLLAAGRGDDLQLEHDPVDVKRVAARAQALAVRLAERKGVTIRLHHGADAAIVEGDEAALTSVVNNLVSNAVRYTPEGGQVTISTELQSPHVVITVSDTGIGMGDEVKAHLFEKFYRSDEARALEPRGLGMGLSIVDRLVKAHEGEIEVTSEPGAGSTFRVRLRALEGD